MNTTKKICIISPSDDIEKIEEREQGIKNLEKLNYKVSFVSSKDKYPKEKGRIITNAIIDPSNDIIMCAVGGYNSNEILEYLDYDKIGKAQKPIIGFSDNTAFLNAIHKKTGQTIYYGPHFAIFCQTDNKEEIENFTTDSFVNAISGKNILIYKHSEEYAETANDGTKHIHNNKLNFKNETPAQGILVGGNLTTLLSLIGTEFEPVFDNKILFLENSKTANYGIIRRSFFQLKQLGVFNKIKGLLVGRFTSDSEISDEQLSELLTLTIENEIPIIYNLAFGHTYPKFTLPIGGMCSMFTDNEMLIFKQNLNVEKI